jgi:hypothetical protein
MFILVEVEHMSHGKWKPNNNQSNFGLLTHLKKPWLERIIDKDVVSI